MPITRLPASGGGFDPAKYPTSLSREGSVTTSPTIGVFTPLLSVTGKPGYITRAVVSTRISTSAAQLRITVDGTVVFNGKTNAANDTATGVIQESEMYPTGTIAGSGVLTRVINFIALIGIPQPYPYTGAAAAQCILPDILPFTNSLLIEVSSAGASQAYNYSINGGTSA